ncbi:hypothetical protein N7462_007771 [Penicillium macrosclerotiorum]|uniref:uncharacterized protein n=1 Tax=Penicillium macrosclerotiorum TaxID=303699 RepID=UPI0025473B02|nr:uncharacterized protein N7462_007771 [Penicillium macrosclerotiorum]KAJ5679527.1 hypothetical protein N7462_007771 [Penicillium macrosclerotiorum]
MTLHGMTSDSPRKATGGAIKYTVEHHRKDGVSEEAFMHWFTNQYLPRAVPIMKKHNILKYAVQKTDTKVGAAFQAEVDQVWPGWKVNDCDVALEYWVYDLESMKNLASDPEWIQTALEDENDWLDPSRSTIRIGYDTTYLESGAFMNIGAQKRRGRVSASFD